MKALRIFIPVVLVMTLLTGCSYFVPFFSMYFSDSQEQAEVQELPIGNEIPSHLSAEDIYWRSKFAFMDRAYAYATHITMDLNYHEDDLELPTDMSIDVYVELDPNASAVNVTTDIAYEVFGIQESASYQEYYRDEDGRLIYYYYEEQEDLCTREEIALDESTAPYAIILDFTLYGYPYPLPGDITMDTHTRMLDDREVYVLTFTQSALDAIGYTGNAAVDEQLSRRTIPIVWYVDAETYMTVRREFSVTQIDDLIGSAIGGFYGLDPSLAQDLTITGFSYTLQDMVFDPVQIQDIPAEVLEKAWQESGFSDA